MANKKTVALTTEQMREIIGLIRNGFVMENGQTVHGSDKIATILVVQANLGLRIGDVLNLKLNDLIKDGNRYRLDIIEDKTGKLRKFTIPDEIYAYIKMYAIDNDRKSTAKIFDISVRAVQKKLKYACDYLGLENISTHSFRKYFATQIYIKSNYNIALVKELLQHSSTTITQRYIGISSYEVEKALNEHIILI